MQSWKCLEMNLWEMETFEYIWQRNFRYTGKYVIRNAIVYSKWTRIRCITHSCLGFFLSPFSMHIFLQNDDGSIEMKNDDFISYRNEHSFIIICWINYFKEGTKILRKFHNDYPSYNNLQFNLFNLFAILKRGKFSWKFEFKSFSV